jgi:hypothetical protein
MRVVFLSLFLILSLTTVAGAQMKIEEVPESAQACLYYASIDAIEQVEPDQAMKLAAICDMAGDDMHALVPTDHYTQEDIDFVAWGMYWFAGIAAYHHTEAGDMKARCDEDKKALPLAKAVLGETPPVEDRERVQKYLDDYRTRCTTIL